MENIFVPFFSLKPFGTGLGLPIALLAARKNLGDLYLEPADGNGTRCVIRLPIPTEAGSRKQEAGSKELSVKSSR